MKLPNLLKSMIGFFYGLLIVSRGVMGVFLWLVHDIIKLKRQKRPSLKECQTVLDWITTQNLPLDMTHEFQLPPHLANITTNGKIQVIHKTDDRYCLLLKTYIGGKDNFEGIFYCHPPVSEKVAVIEDKTVIYIEGKYCPEPFFVRKRYDDNYRFEVYFDLH
jgi:hypothetical protein